MMSEAKFHWVWRGMVVVLLGMTLHVTLKLFVGMWFVVTPICTAWQLLGGSFAVGLHTGKSVAFTLPTAAFCLAVFALFVYRPPKKGAGESYCRRCGYILRGLSKPRCPECGETI